MAKHSQARPGRTLRRQPFERGEQSSLQWVTAELLRRTLRSLEDCEAVWTHADNPIALVGALALLGEAPMPRWLSDALLAVLVPGVDAWASPIPGVVARQWARARREAVNAYRVLKFSAIRLGALEHRAQIKITRQEAAMMAALKLRGTIAVMGARTNGRDHPSEALPNAGAALEKVVSRIARDLKTNPWRYWAPPSGFEARYLAALQGLVQKIEQARHPSA
jgi:hypothetical protein